MIPTTRAHLGLAIGLLLYSPAHAQRYTPVALCAIDSINTYESLTGAPGIGGDYPSGSVQSITTAVGDTASPGAPTAANGDNEFVVLLLDTNNDGTPELLGSSSCAFSTTASPVGCTVTQNITVPAVTEDTTFRGRAMLSYNDTNPADGCGPNAYGDSVDFLVVADVAEAITLTDVSAWEDGGPITVTATLSHNVRDGSGFVPFTVEYTTDDGTATTIDPDYTTSAGTLTFNGQAGDTQTITIVPTADFAPEGDETLTVRLFNLSNSTHGIDTTDTALVTLLDDDEEVDLLVTKSVDNSTPNIGETIIFSLEVGNLGPADIVDASVADLVPSGFSSVTAIAVPPGTSFSISGNTIDWTGIDITSGATLTATYSAVVLPP
ncbi:MAG: DUF11 domain-containing protein [Gammaproteobacteria bacterium]|nr:DUF11 domain-containing protein [Gammaproteobacteria bacterium]